MAIELGVDTQTILQWTLHPSVGGRLLRRYLETGLRLPFVTDAIVAPSERVGNRRSGACGQLGRGDLGLKVTVEQAA